MIRVNSIFGQEPVFRGQSLGLIEIPVGNNFVVGEEHLRISTDRLIRGFVIGSDLVLDSSSNFVH